jgi:cyclic pyranopterin phosphate synthase
MTLPQPVEGLELRDEGPLLDRFGRVHTYLRVSVTDRCNFRCTYCLPAEGIAWMPRQDVLSFEEIERLVRAFARMGIERIRLTGGEPTVRRDLVQLVRRIAAIDGVRDLSMTTNAHRLAEHAQSLFDAGLRRINVSIDALDPVVFAELTRGGDVHRVLAGIDAAIDAGMRPVKLNAVVVGGTNDHEVPSMIEHFASRADRVQLRFIEFMPFGTDRHQHVPSSELRKRLSARYSLEPAEEARDSGGPAATWRIRETGQIVGFISPITEHFCGACNRLRLSADGELRTCLSRDDTPSLRDMLRQGVGDAQLARAIRQMVWGKVAGHEAHLGDAARTFEGVMTRIGG